MYAWERCTHEGIGRPGCPTCDPDKHRCLARAQRHLDACQRDFDALRARAEQLEAQVAQLREALLVGKDAVDHQHPSVWPAAQRGIVDAALAATDGTWLDEHDAKVRADERAKTTAELRNAATTLMLLQKDATPAQGGACTTCGGAELVSSMDGPKWCPTCSAPSGGKAGT